MTCRDIQRRLLVERYAKGLALPNYTPSGWFECDVFEITKAGFFREYEIKLSVSDFKADAAKVKTRYEYNQPGENGRFFNEIMVDKHDQLAKGSVKGPSRFYYVAPKGLLVLDQIPQWAGFIEAHESEWGGVTEVITRVIREAPQLHRSKTLPEIKLHAQSVCYWRFMKLFLKQPQTERKEG